MSTKQRAAKDRKFLESLAGSGLSLGLTLESIRLGEGMTLEAFADRLGISRANLCDIEKGRAAVSPRRAAEFARKLGYSRSQFVCLALEDLLKKDGLEDLVKISAA